MKKHIIAALALSALAASASAQLASGVTVEVLFDGSQTNGAITTNCEYDGVAVTPNGSTVYVFDSIGTYDAIFAWNGSSFSTFATEAELAAGSASAGDLDADATNLYTSIWDSTDQRIWRIPHAGGFASAVNMVDDSGTLTVNMDEIAVDSKNSRLVIVYNDFGSAAAEDIVTVPLTANAATPTVLATEASIEAALATITGYVDDTADDFNVSDITVQSDGDIIVAHGFSSNRQINGSLLRVTETGTVSVFRTADAIIAAAGGVPADMDIGSVQVNALSNDEIVAIVSFTGGTTPIPAFITVVSADGSTQRSIGNVADLLGALPPATQTSIIQPAGSTIFRFDSKSTSTVDANDDLYFFRQAGSTQFTGHAVVKVGGLIPANVREWMMF